jgi:hypothetical protein
MCSPIDDVSYGVSESDNDDDDLPLEHRPLRASDFTETPPGTVIRMWYNATHVGTFEWRHDSVVHEHKSGHTPRLRGSIRYDGANERWGPIGEILYTQHRVLCCARGASSAQPVWASANPPQSRIGWLHRGRSLNIDLTEPLN